MSDSSSNAEQPLTDDQLMTSWTRITLDFGDPGYEVAAEDLEGDENPSDRLRQEIEEMIGAIRQVAQKNGADEQELATDISDFELTEEIFQKMLEESDTDSVPEAEQVRADEDSEEPKLETELDADQEINAEFEKRVTEATTDDVVQALLLAAVDLPEIMVYEADGQHVDVYVLTIELENDIFVTAHLGDDSKIRPGTDIEEFTSQLLDELPARGGLCADQQSYSFTAPVTALGEDFTVDADAQVAALIELEMPEIPVLVAQTFVTSPVEVAPADNGWSLVHTDPFSMVNLLQNLQKPAIVAESTGTHHHLAFITPDSKDDAAASDSVQWSEWVNKVVGDPQPQRNQDGHVIDLVWGPAKVQTRYLPQGSFAIDTLWMLPGVLPEPLNFVQMSDQIENLTWFYGLDESGARRLRNYVEDSQSELGMESVLQLLQIPDELSKIAQGRLDIENLPGHRSLLPSMNSLQTLRESVAAYPNGTDAMSRASRALLNRPWVFTADGVAQLGVSGLLAAMASRRFQRGESARTPAVLAALFASVGITEFAIGRAYKNFQQKNFAGLSSQSGLDSEASSLMDELHENYEAQNVRGTETFMQQVERLSEKAKQKSWKQLKRFFGE